MISDGRGYNHKLLKQVASGKVSVKDARVALEEATLTEEQMDAAINHGVFNPAEPGTVISASLAPSGKSAPHNLLLRMGNLLGIVLVWHNALRATKWLYMGPATIVLSPCYGDYYSYHDGYCIPKVGFA